MFLREVYRYGKRVTKERGLVIGVFSATLGAAAMGVESGLNKLQRKSKLRRASPDGPKEP